MTSTETILQLLPELILVLAGTLIYLAGAFCPKTTRPTLIAFLALGGVFLILAGNSRNIENLAPTVSGPIAVDGFGEAVRAFLVVAGGLLLLLTRRSAEDKNASEYAGSLLMLLAGLMICARANDLVLIFVGLELVSIPTYVLLSLGKRGAATEEATTKYFYLSILSSALMLYGFSFLYGASGSTNLTEIGQSLGETVVAPTTKPTLETPAPLGEGVRKLAGIGMLFVVAGLGFRLTAVPFHFYAPDVYQGAGHANAGLLSTMPKVAGLVVMTRLIAVAMPGVDHLSWKVVLAISLVTMTLGNILALWQNDLRRMLAYSSVAHGGYLLIGVAVGLYQRSQYGATLPAETIGGIGSSLFYVAVYTFATVGIFAVFTTLGTDAKPVDTVDDLGGLISTRPLSAIVLSIFLFSLAGIPPFAGFWGKFNLFLGAVQIGGADADEPGKLWFLALAIVGALNAAIAAAYYLRLIAKMCFGPSTNALTDNPNPAPRAAWALCAVLVVGAGIFPGMMQAQAQRAGEQIYTATELPANGSAANNSSATGSSTKSPTERPVAINATQADDAAVTR